MRAIVAVKPEVAPGAAATPREAQIEELLCRGFTQLNIAARLKISASTVSVHALNLYRKRGVCSQIDLLLAYLKRNAIFEFPEVQEAPFILPVKRSSDPSARHAAPERQTQ
jgi:DNA-binding CsgD family transcriptional regulator